MKKIYKHIFAGVMGVVLMFVLSVALIAPVAKAGSAPVVSPATASGGFIYTPTFLPDLVAGAEGPGALIFNVYKYMVGLVGIFAVGLIIYAGILRTISASQQKIQQSNAYIMGALKGIVLLFGAQILFNTINKNIIDVGRIDTALKTTIPKIQTATTTSWWNKLGDLVAPDATSTPGGTAQSSTDLYGGAHPVCSKGTEHYPNCPSGTVDLATKIEPCSDCVLAGVNTNSGFYTSSNACFGYERGGCLVNSTLANTLKTLTDSARANNTQWLVTGSYPPGANHSDPCHWNGTCVDIAFTGKSVTAANVNDFIQQAKSAGLTVVNEYPVGEKPKSFGTTTGGHLHVHL